MKHQLKQIKKPTHSVQGYKFCHWTRIEAVCIACGEDVGKEHGLFDDGLFYRATNRAFVLGLIVEGDDDCTPL